MKDKIMNNTMKTFLIIWFGQLISLMGTAMTRFALLIWAYDKTGDATTLAMLGFFSFGSYVLASPIAGIWVDRWDKRKVMIFADLGAGFMTIGMLSLYAANGLEIWHLYVAETLTGVFDAFHLNAYSVTTSLLVPKNQYARIGGLRSLAYHGSKIGAPFIAGFLLAFIDIDGVMWIDVVTFLTAVGTLLFVKIPRPAVSKDGLDARGNMWQEIKFGFRYIYQRPGLRGLLGIFMGMNFIATLTYFGVLPAMILARSGGDEVALASVQGALGLGGFIGGLIISIWGGTKKQIHMILAGAGISFFLGDFMFAVGRDTLPWVFAALSAAVFIPAIASADRAIWQRKVAPDVQGRVFSVKAMLQESMMPIGYLMAGPLADKVFEPAMMPNGALADTFGWLVGTGAGAGMGLMFVGTWLAGTILSLSGYIFASVRNVEEDLPDHETEIVEEEKVTTGELTPVTA